MSRQKDVLTTGDVAKICSVAPRTVSKWFDSGQLSGYRIPGSKDRRIPLNALMRFMKQHNIPLDSLSSGRTRVLIVDADPEARDVLYKALVEGTSFEVRCVSSGFAAGLECERMRPDVMLLDAHLPDADCRDVLRHVRENPSLGMTRVVAMSSRLTDGQGNQLLSQGFDGYLRKPFSASQVVRMIDGAIAA
jgi:excisionase family DNA binding protein